MDPIFLEIVSGIFALATACATVLLPIIFFRQRKLKGEFEPNGGNSLRDRVDHILDMTVKTHGVIAEHENLDTRRFHWLERRLDLLHDEIHGVDGAREVREPNPTSESEFTD